MASTLKRCSNFAVNSVAFNDILLIFRFKQQRRKLYKELSVALNLKTEISTVRTSYEKYFCRNFQFCNRFPLDKCAGNMEL
jgi:phage gp16-like protein